MNLQETLRMIAFIVILGTILSFLVRILRECYSTKYFFRAVQLSIKFLIVFPFFLFPIIANKNKNQLAVIIAKEILEKENTIKKTKKELEKQILCGFTIRYIFRLWGCILKNIIVDYDKYVDSNLKLVRNIIAREKKAEGDNSTHKSNNKITSKLSYQRTIVSFLKPADLERIASCVSA